MARLESASSLELERSMNMQSRIMTLREHLRHERVIDSLDDERRERRFNLDKWNEDMQKNFSRIRKHILENVPLEDLRSELEKLDKKEDEFNSIYQKDVKEVKEQELHYEELNDKLILWILNLIDQYEINLRDENSNTERKSIEENRLRKKEVSECQNKNTP
ncbi:hypothetical protein [Ilyobacter polytropus]|uniref:Uncharacterized protein n=1 Tax=Ilyobacter polytropus (strain ATCC 51220 / DSM 2926 / LMG 16218 / CuHBu1) TaxID=572544 RepID=E3H7E4_ILYPC|nr:hypothetical protein [Ilyobacter polytropus]ADO82840.1 hypothetical protein Ilyop_1059 [Ilyobacter polytropus DSM 2926]